MSTDLTFITNEAGNHLRDRFNTLLTTDTRHFDCLVGYFYISGFHKIYPFEEWKRGSVLTFDTQKFTRERWPQFTTRGLMHRKPLTIDG
jgi:hypothetical protein